MDGKGKEQVLRVPSNDPKGEREVEKIFPVKAWWFHCYKAEARGKSWHHAGDRGWSDDHRAVTTPGLI